MTFRHTLHRARLATLLLGLASIALAQSDGPYVLRDASGAMVSLSVEDSAVGPRKLAAPVKLGESVTVAAVGQVPAFSVPLRAPDATAADEVRTAAHAPVFVVADTHGEYEILIAMLRKHGIVDARLNWSFGRGHLAVLGDVFDRGEYHTEILWLLYSLQEQARHAGGGAHLLLGNHEVMVLTGDQRYLHPKYQRTAAVIGASNYGLLFSAESVLGQWMRTRPALLKLNDLLLVHGGVSRAVVDAKLRLRDVNDGVRSLLSRTPPPAVMRERAELLAGPQGPVWYRGYFADQQDFPTASEADIARILQWFGAKKILVGHTIVPTITPLYRGKVIAVQVYPKRDDAGVISFECLLIKRGVLSRATLDGLSPLN